MDSKQLQDRAQSILNGITDGITTQQASAIRGVGYAVLALVEFLRESEQPKCTCVKEKLAKQSKKKSKCCPTAIEVMQEGLNG